MSSLQETHLYSWCHQSSVLTIVIQRLVYVILDIITALYYCKLNMHTRAVLVKTKITATILSQWFFYPVN